MFDTPDLVVNLNLRATLDQFVEEEKNERTAKFYIAQMCEKADGVKIDVRNTLIGTLDVRN